MSLADPAATPQPGGASNGGRGSAGPHACSNHKLLAILEIARAIAAQPSLEAVLAACLRSLVETLDAADAGVLLIYDPAGDLLRPRAAQGYDMAILERLRLTPGESMSGKAFQSGEAQLYSTPEAVAEAMADLKQINREIFSQATVGLRQPLSAICVPLVTGRAKVGVLVLENLRQQGRFGPEDLAFLRQVADVIAVSIEQIRQREELQAARAISEANRLKAELLSTLAHEMRTPLTSIKGYASALLMDDATFSPQTQREFLQFIDQECDLLQNLVHDLLGPAAGAVTGGNGVVKCCSFASRRAIIERYSREWRSG